MATAFEIWAARRSWRLIYTAELTVARKADGQELTIHLATQGGQWDAAHNWRPYLVAPPRIRSRAQGVTGQSSLINYGSLGLALPRGRAVDSEGLISSDRLLADFTFEGRPVVIRAGGPGLAWADWWTLNCVMGQPEWDNLAASIPINGRTAELADKQVPPNLYEEGGAIPEATVGKAKPVVLGYCRNIEPVLIDETSHLYQFHDPAQGPVQAVEAVRDKGLLKTGGYTLDLAQGTIALGAKPAGTLTLDVRGQVSTPLGGYVQTPGGLVQELLRAFGGAASGEIDAAAFAAYDLVAPWTAGIYLTRQVTIKQAIDAILTGLLSIFGDRRDGRWSLRRLEDLDGEPDLVITEDMILKDSYRHRPDTNSPAWRVTIEGRRNWTVIGNPADGVSEADRAWLGQQFQTRSASDEAIKSLYPKAKELGPHQTYLTETAHLEALAARWLALYSQERGEDSFTTKLRAMTLDMGDLVKVIRRRHGMDDGKLFRAIGQEEDHQSRRIKPELWG